MSVLSKLIAMFRSDSEIPHPVPCLTIHDAVGREADYGSVPDKALEGDAKSEVQHASEGGAGSSLGLPNALIPFLPLLSDERSLHATALSIAKRSGAVEELVTIRLDGTSRGANRFSIPVPVVATASSKLYWVQPGEDLELQGLTISCGLIYTGLDTRGDEPSMLHPKWPIERVWNRAEQAPPFNPSYAGLSPAQRFSYLDWLSKGARDAGVDPAYAVLRLFGLERRLILDGACLTDEADALVTEINRLARCFSGNWTIFGNAFRLKQYVYLRRELASPTDLLPPFEGVQPFGLPISLSLALGRFANAGKLLPATWALRWSLTDTLIARRTAVDRCPAEFEAAFTKVYKRRHGDGLKLPQNKTRLKYSYTASSRAVTGSSLRVVLEDLPDVAAVQGPRNKLQEVVEEATSLIDSYSRFIGRREGRAGTLEAYLTLPIDLWPGVMLERVEALRVYATEFQVFSFAELLERLGHTEQPSSTLARDLASVLQTLRLGFEPDVLRGARRPSPETKVLVFSLAGEHGEDREAGPPKSASTLISLMAIMSLADGEASDVEHQAVERTIASWPEITLNSRVRLRARYRLQTVQPPSLSSLKTLAAGLEEGEQLEIGRMLAELANADGIVSPAEVRLLEELYRTLKLDPKLAYVHLYSSGLTAPVHKQNPTESSLRGAPSMDAQRIARLQAETAQVSELLASVFRDDEDQAEEAEGPALSMGSAQQSELAISPVTSVHICQNSESSLMQLAREAANKAPSEQESAVIEIVYVLHDYLVRSFDETLTNYLVDDQMHSDRVITWSYLSRRLVQKTPFRQDVRGALVALREAVQVLEADGALTRLDAALSRDRYRTGALVFAISSTPGNWLSRDIVIEVMPEVERPEAPLLPSLDQKHSGLLKLLLTRPQWSREELLQAAFSHQLMLDGAMETINEAALDATGNMILDGDDPVSVDSSLLEILNS